MINVAYVEDDPLLHEFMGTWLSLQSDVRLVGSAYDAASGFDCVRERSVDVLLLDYRLPDMDGLEFLRTARAWSQETLPPTLLVTGSADERMTLEARTLGARGVVGKARARTDLMPAIHSVANGGQWFRETLHLPSRETRRVLVAEHDQNTRALLAEALTEMNCSITWAWKAGDALELLEREAFDLVLLNYRLPGRMVAVIQQLEQGHPDLPVLLLSSLPTILEEYRPCANTRGVLRSPLSCGQVQEQVRLILAQSNVNA